MDTDGDGGVDLEEFVEAMSTVEDVKMAAETFKVKHIFDRYDSDGSGELSVEELKEMMKEVWKDADSIKEMIQEVDKDGNGEVSWEEFCHLMSKSNKVEIPAPPTDVGVAPQMPDGSPDSSTATQAFASAGTQAVATMGDAHYSAAAVAAHMKHAQEHAHDTETKCATSSSD